VEAPPIEEEVIEVARSQKKNRTVQAVVSEVEPSSKHEGLRWLRLDGYEYPFALWDSVFEGDLSEGDTIEVEYVPIEDRNFAKIVRLELPAGNNPKPGVKADRFSKTEIGLMASVALKVAGQLVAAQLSANSKAKLSTQKLFDLADGLYEWLCLKRVKELAAQQTEEAEEGPGA